MITIAAAEAVSRPSAVYQVWLSPCVCALSESFTQSLCMHLLSGCYSQCYFCFHAAATVEAALQLGFVLCNPSLAACMAAKLTIRLAQSRLNQKKSCTSTRQLSSCAQADKHQHRWLLQLPTCHMQILWNMQGMLVHTLGVVGGAATGVICYAMLLIIRVQPWWHAQYFIPTLGMILGNCISGVSVGLSSVMEELTTGQSAALQHPPS